MTSVVLITDSIGDRRSGKSLRQHQIAQALVPLGALTVVSMRPASEREKRVVEDEFGADLVPLSTGLLSVRESVAKWVSDVGLPWTLARRDTTNANASLTQLLAALDPSVIWITTPTGWIATPSSWHARSVFDFDDRPNAMHREIFKVAMRRWWRRVRGQLRRFWGKPTIRHPVPVDDVGTVLKEADSALRWRVLENRIAVEARAVCSSNDAEATRFARRHPNHFVAPNGFDSTVHVSGDWGTLPSIVFPATFSYHPNLEGAEWLLEEVVPRIHRTVAGLPIVLAGTGPDSLSGYESVPHVTVTGALRSMDDVLRGGAIVVSPLFGGSGTRMKILEAWARALPVVSTSKGAEGLSARHGIDTLIADSAHDFANACVRLARSPDTRRRLGLAGHARIADEFEWDILGRRLRADLAAVK